jgi:hypothetical protein
VRRAAFGALLLSAPAHGESASALKGAEIEAALIGKTFRVITRRVPIGDRDNPTGMTTRTDGVTVQLDIFVRDDRSIIFQCTAHGRDGTTWSCTGGGTDNFCYQFTASRGGRKQCYAVLRDGAEFRLRLTSGPPSTIDGELMRTR